MTPPRCPRCGGYLYPDDDTLTCLSCGRSVAPSAAPSRATCRSPLLASPSAARRLGLQPSERHSRPIFVPYSGRDAAGERS